MPEIREKVRNLLKWLGVQLDPTANQNEKTLLSNVSSRGSMLRVPADEEVVIARHMASAITDSPVHPSSSKWKAS